MSLFFSSSPSFYVTFWQLSLEDICLNATEKYATEIAALEARFDSQIEMARKLGKKRPKASAWISKLKSEKIIDIYGIAWRDIDENTKQYLDENGNPFTRTATDNRGLFTKIAGISAIPETWIVNQEGEVVKRFQGNLPEFAIDEIKEFLSSNKI